MNCITVDFDKYDFDKLLGTLYNSLFLKRKSDKLYSICQNFPC